MRKKSKYWKTMKKLLEWQFPKGKCKERGSAMVLISYIEIMLKDDEKKQERDI